MQRIRAIAMLGALTLAVAATAVAQPAGPRPAPRTPHALAGKTDCLSCHGSGANAHITSVPAAHHYANGACAACHRPVGTAAPASTHAMDAAHTRCAVCHVANSRVGAKAPPASHASYDVSICKDCHEAKAGG